VGGGEELKVQYVIVAEKLMGKERIGEAFNKEEVRGQREKDHEGKEEL
jgi:hypothetical protein